jgi:hypothetical protein
MFLSSEIHLSGKNHGPFLPGPPISVINQFCQYQSLRDGPSFAGDRQTSKTIANPD